MIDLYYAPTPNGHKITLFLEEVGLPYRIHRVNISAGEQFKPDFLSISPNNKIPAIVDQQPVDGGTPISLFESGEILLYLAEKTGKLLSKGLRERAATLQWLFWQVAGFGPMLGRITTSTTTRRSRCLTPSSATSWKPNGCTACWKPSCKSTRIWAATTTASPISPPTRGWCRIRASASIWRITRRCATGSSASATARRPSAPISWLNRANPAPRLDSPPPGSHIAPALSFLYFPCILNANNQTYGESLMSFSQPDAVIRIKICGCARSSVSRKKKSTTDRTS